METDYKKKHYLLKKSCIPGDLDFYLFTYTYLIQKRKITNKLIMWPQRIH